MTAQQAKKQLKAELHIKLTAIQTGGLVPDLINRVMQINSKLDMLDAGQPILMRCPTCGGEFGVKGGDE